MNSNLTDLNILVDRSASMGPLTQAVRTGIKELIQNQKQQDGDCNITVAQFDRDPTSPAIWNPVVNKRNAFLPDGFGAERPNSAIVDYLCEGVPLDVVSDGVLDGYEPRGNTPLLEACRDFINRIGDRLRQTPEHLRPAKVIVVIQTDGEENSSIGVTQSQLKEMVQHQESRYNWQFVFLGANIDAFGTGMGLGVNMASCLQYAASEKGVTRAYGSTSAAINNYRAGVSNTVNFNDSDQQSQDDLGARPGILGVSS